MDKYPKYLYRAGETILVRNEDEESALEGKWYESPADVPEDGQELDRDQLLKEAEALGLKLDKRQGVDKIKAAIDEAKKGAK